MTPEERQQVLLLCFAETIIRLLVSMAPVKTRRANKLNASLQNLLKADETYKGHLSDEDYNKAIKLYTEFERRIETVLNE